MAEPGATERRVGVLGTLRRLTSTLVEIVHTRIELAVAELEEQKLRIAQLIMLSFLALFFGSMALIFGTLAVVMAYWDRNPVAVLGGFAALYLAIGVIAGLAWRARVKARPRLLSATLTELERDREELKSS